jgi:hypothetical protein
MKDRKEQDGGNGNQQAHRIVDRSFPHPNGRRDNKRHDHRLYPFKYGINKGIDFDICKQGRNQRYDDHRRQNNSCGCKNSPDSSCKLVSDKGGCVNGYGTGYRLGCGKYIDNFIFFYVKFRLSFSLLIAKM